MNSTERKTVDNIFQRLHGCLFIGCAATSDMNFQTGTGGVPHRHQVDDVLHYCFELKRHANPLEFFLAGAVEADFYLIQTGLDQPLRPIAIQQGTVGKNLHLLYTLTLCVAYPVFKLFVHKRLAEIVKVDLPAAEDDAFIYKTHKKGVVHPGNLPLNVPPRANGAAGVARIGGFDTNHLGKGVLGKIKHTPANPTHRL